MYRIDKENYYLDIAETVLERGTCLRRNYGAIIVNNDQIVSTGYVGAPRGRKNCIDLGHCVREANNVPRGERYELCRSVHAEQNAIISAASMGNAIEDGTIYITHQPCVICAKMIVNAGIKRIVVREGYPDELAMEILDEAGLTVERLGEKGE